MRMDKLTNSLQKALAEAQSLAVGRDHNFIEPVHLLLALLGQRGGTCGPLLSKSGVDVASLQSKVEAAVEGLPRVSGGETEVRIYQGDVERGSARTPFAIQSSDDPGAAEDFSRVASNSQGGGQHVDGSALGVSPPRPLWITSHRGRFFIASPRARFVPPRQVFDFPLLSRPRSGSSVG